MLAAFLPVAGRERENVQWVGLEMLYQTSRPGRSPCAHDSWPKNSKGSRSQTHLMSLLLLRQVFMLQARPAILHYRGLCFLFFFNIPSSQVCFGTALQKQKKKSQLETDRHIHPNIAMENLAGKEVERGNENIKKNNKPPEKRLPSTMQHPA